MTTKDPYADITPADSTKTFAEVLQDSEFIKLVAPTIQEGDPSVDFELPLYDFSSGARVETGEMFHLARASANQPVALIFGSYT